MKITLEQAKKYLELGGNFCPFCKSDEIQAIAGIDGFYSELYQNVVCENCGETWTDIYVLKGVTN